MIFPVLLVLVMQSIEEYTQLLTRSWAEVVGSESENETDDASDGASVEDYVFSILRAISTSGDAYDRTIILIDSSRRLGSMGERLE